MNKFIIEFNGEEAFKAVRLFEQQATEYDNDKVITPILFVKVNDYAIESYEQYQNIIKGSAGCPRIEISREHLPSRLWLFVNEDDIREIVWE